MNIPIDISSTEITKETLAPLLMYGQPIRYKNWLFRPVTMEHYFDFMQWQQSLTIRKNSTFQEKDIIRMTYRKFLKYCHMNIELALKYKMGFLPYVYIFWYSLIQFVCYGEIIVDEDGRETINTDVKIDFDKNNDLTINGHTITDKECNDIRRILIYQNDIDFDVDEFINYETEKALKEAMEKEQKNKGAPPTVEDHIDSLVVGLKIHRKEIMDMTIREFWRYIKRLNKHDDYIIRRIGESSGLVKYKEPAVHWMSPLDDDDKYENVKMSRSELDKIAG